MSGTAALRASLRDAVPAAPAARITQVISTMKAVVAALPPTDGVAAFTVLYLAVTQAVHDKVRSPTFEDPPFVRWLDVAFANLYFDALRSFARGSGSVPKAWAPLLEARGRRGVAPLQFALAGMNAHINRDLPVALVQTCESRKLELQRRSPQQRDFRRINALLAHTEDQVKSRFLRGSLAHVGAALGDLDDVVAMWKVERAREAAWVHAETLWLLRGRPAHGARFLRTLDRTVGLAGRGLLRPVGLQ